MVRSPQSRKLNQPFRGVCNLANDGTATNCKECQKLFEDTLRHGSSFYFNKTLSDLEEGEKKGCEVCHLQCCLLTPPIRKSMTDGAAHITSCRMRWVPEEGQWILDFQYRRWREHSGHSSEEWNIFDSVPLFFKSCCNERDGLFDRWETVRRWIQNCDQSHVRCRRSIAYNFLPSRLIDTGLDDLNNVRLCLKEDIPADVRFCTLSHCWGKHIPLQLRTENLNKLREEIPLSQLSDTFKDALEIARILGIKYIWIDTLCIIQDDAVDWLNESAQMADIYENSYFNIAATRAEDGSQGCVPLLAHRDSGPSNIKAVFEASGSASRKNPNLQIKYHGLPDEEAERIVDFTFEPSIWAGEVDKSPLLTRGWVLQEMVLADRVLHCGRTQMFWECNELRASENFPCGIPGLSISKDTMMSSTTEDHVDRFQIWHNMVMRYSKLALTYPEKDKLVAIEGLARRMPYQFDQYLFGLWKPNLINDLVWYVPWNPNGTAFGRDMWDDKTLTAPSWSWASCNQVIYFSHPGEAKSGGHEVGSILVEISNWASRSGGHVSDDCPLALMGCIGQANFRSSLDYNDRYTRYDRIELSAGFANAHFDRQPPQTNTKVLYVPVQMTRPSFRRNIVNSDVWHIQGLIVEPRSKSRGVGGQYRRLGCFQLFDDHKYLLEALKATQDQLEGQIEYEEYLGPNAYGFVRYKISVY